MSKQPEITTQTFNLEDPNLSSMAELQLRLEGFSPLMMHRFSEKARKEMEDKQQGRASKKKAPRDPVRDFLDGLYVIGDRPKSTKELEKIQVGFPAVCFKASAVRAAKSNGVAMTDARGMFFVEAEHADEQYELVSLECSTPEMDTRPVRLSNVTSLAYRPLIREWAVDLRITYNARKVTAEQLIGWFKDAGISVGVGEMRPTGKNSSGTFGRWNVVAAEAKIPTHLKKAA